MPLFAVFLLLLLGLGRASDELMLEVPSAPIVQRLASAKVELTSGLTCGPEHCDDVALNTLALTALGRFAEVRTALGAARTRTPLWLVAAHSYWLASGDLAFVREQWAFIQEVLFATQHERLVNDGGVLLAATDGMIAMARALDDSSAVRRARAVYALAERRAQETPGLFAPALGLLEAERAEAHINRLTDTLHAAWPLGTGLVAMGLYEYHRDTAAFRMLDRMAVAQSTSAAMYVLPLLRGLLGWEVDAAHRAVALEPHLPAAWNTMTVTNLPAGQEKLTLAIRRENGMYALQITRARTMPPLTLHLSPAFPRGTRIRAVKVNDEDVPIQVEANKQDLHVVIETMLHAETNVEIEYDPPRRSLPR